jgi:hypothetical protein
MILCRFACRQASNTWCNNVSGSRVVLCPTSLLHLTEIERPVAQKAALARLQSFDLGLKINIPKGMFVYTHTLADCCTSASVVRPFVRSSVAAWRLVRLFIATLVGLDEFSKR